MPLPIPNKMALTHLLFRWSKYFQMVLEPVSNDDKVNYLVSLVDEGLPIYFEQSGLMLVYGKEEIEVANEYLTKQAESEINKKEADDETLIKRVLSPATNNIVEYLRRSQINFNTKLNSLARKYDIDKDHSVCLKRTEHKLNDYYYDVEVLNRLLNLDSNRFKLRAFSDKKTGGKLALGSDLFSITDPLARLYVYEKDLIEFEKKHQLNAYQKTCNNTVDVNEQRIQKSTELRARIINLLIQCIAEANPHKYRKGETKSVNVNAIAEKLLEFVSNDKDLSYGLGKTTIRNQLKSAMEIANLDKDTCLIS